uniref:Uncharacterized protein n=1 Tax=Nelumbo nucifera TaxID=4432 RepID=A0A822YU25_NELNU|nr:TPA_asm: hypothetical protein HUJ06_005701 [Nelumbo nucifera]
MIRFLSISDLSLWLPHMLHGLIYQQKKASSIALIYCDSAINVDSVVDKLECYCFGVSAIFVVYMQVGASCTKILHLEMHLCSHCWSKFEISQNMLVNLQ